MKSFIATQRPTLFKVILAIVFFFGLSSWVQAANSVTLTVNNGATAAIINGTEVTLRWEVTGAVRDCSINNGVGAIPNSELPTGSRRHTPPPNNETTYRMTCVGGNDSVVVAILPEITLTTDPVQPVIDAVSQSARINGITWSTSYATRCDSQITITPIDGWSQVGLTSTWDTSNRVSGVNDADRFIRGDTKISLRCYNDVNGQSRTKELIIRPTRTGPAPDPTVQITAQPKAGPNNGSANIANVTLHPATGLGWVQIRTTAQNSGWCDRSITFASGSGDAWGVTTIQGSPFLWHNDKMTMEQNYGIWETTTFSIACRQTKNNTSGNNTVASASVTVPFTPPPGLLPVPVVNVSGPATAQRDSLTGASNPSPSLSLSTSGVNRCFYKAYQEGGNEYNVPGWTDNVKSTLGVASRTIVIRETTTFEARCLTADGREAIDTQRVELVSGAALPPPTVTLIASAASVEPEADGVGRVELSWSSTNATYCEVTADPDTGSDYTLFDTQPNNTGTYEVFDDTIFTAVCGRTGDTSTSSDTVSVDLGVGATTIDDAATVAAGECLDGGTVRPMEAWEMVGPGGVCMNAVDLQASTVAISNLAGTPVSSTTGEYNNLRVLSSIDNYGPGAVPAATPISYVTYIKMSSRPDSVSPTGYHSAGIVAPASGSFTKSATLEHVFNNIPFGTHQFCSRVNLDGSPNFPERVADTTNNTKCTEFTLPPPVPPMTLTSDRLLIRSGQRVTIAWSVPISYPLTCEVSGPGIVTQSFSAPGSTSGSVLTDPLTTSSSFSLTCTEPGGTVFNGESVSVDVVPEFEEI